MALKEQDRQFLMSLAYATGVILFWRGIWEGSLEIPILDNPWVSLFLGLAILTLTGWVYREFDVIGAKASRLLNALTNALHDSSRGVKHNIFYFDELTKKHHKVPARKVKKVERNHVIVEQKGRELFIPIHRITKIQKGKTTIWVK